MNLYMNHGRTKEGPPTDEDGNEVDDWGFDGPSLENVTSFHCTYGAHQGRFNVYFTDKAARDAAFELTGWETWDDNALTADFNADGDLIKTWNNERNRWEYFGDWGME